MRQRKVLGLSRKVWLVGENNPYQSPASDPDHFWDLYPNPPQSAGARLCRILGYDPASPDLYLEAFERRNLLAGSSWKVADARKAASALLREAVVAGGEHAFVLLGAKVAAAFGFPFTPFFAAGFPGTAFQVLVVPHPSGRSPAWHDPTMAPRVRAAVAALRSQEKAEQ